MLKIFFNFFTQALHEYKKILNECKLMIFTVIVNFLALKIWGFVIWSVMLCGLKSNPINFVKKQTKGVYVFFSSSWNLKQTTMKVFLAQSTRYWMLMSPQLFRDWLIAFKGKEKKAFFYNVFFTTLKFLSVRFHKKNPSIIFNLFCKLLIFLFELECFKY